jgi:hypothetical protein
MSAGGLDHQIDTTTGILTEFLKDGVRAWPVGGVQVRVAMVCRLQTVAWSRSRCPTTTGHIEGT